MTDHPNVASFRSFVNEWLPTRLRALADVIEYSVDDSAVDSISIHMKLADRNGGVSVTYSDIPAPRADGTFLIGTTERAVTAAADRADLANAEIRCVGEQIRDEIEPRLVAPPDLPEYTAELLQAWLPIDRWVSDFLIHSPTSQPIDSCNWLSRQTHLRRLRMPDDDAGFHRSQIGRACPIETPEGPNCGKILFLAAGAEIRDGKIVVIDDSPQAALGLSASMVPLLEHNDVPRQLMGCNMMRQWLTLGDREPAPVVTVAEREGSSMMREWLDLGEREAALVQTGNEPESGEAWYGRNLLTGYIFWKNINYEDGIVVSESAAAKLASPDPLDIGDKLSNRHGTKGTIGAILPDDEMPRMPDGTPVDLIFDMSGLHTRNNFGQIREAVLGNIAHARRQPIICPPFGSPSADEIREMLREVGLPESGQQQLADGDRPLDMPSTVGYVYWGKTFHRAADKLGAWAADPVLVSRRQRQGEMENWALRSCGAFENILENINTRSMDRAGIGRLVDEVVGGPVRQSPAPSALFQKLQQRIRTAGILASFDGHEVSFSLAKPSPEDAPLSLPVPHPWCAEIELTHVGPPGGKAAPYDRFIEANARAARSINGSAPDAIRDSARAELSDELRRLLNALDVRDDMRLGNRVMFSTRSVLATGYDLELGEVGLPEPMAWSIFSPLVAREIGNEMARERSPEAMRALRQVMADNVVLVNRAPTLTPTNITAFTPVLRDGPAIRLHPLCCRLFNADYDGDQVAVLLPITREAQAEAREKLTLEGHIRLDPGAMISHMTPCMTHLYGLAWAARSGECRADLVAAWPESLPGPPQDLTRAWLMNALSSLTEDPIAFLDALQQLMHLGVRFATQSGASLHPFVGEGLSLPAQPQHEWPGAWHAYCDSVDAAISAQTDLDSPDLGPQMTLIASGARGNMHQLRQLVGPRGPLGGSPWSGPIIRKGFRDGVPPAEYFESIRTSRGALQSLNTSMAVWGRDLKGNMLPTSDTVLALAIRARRPGEVLAKAAVDGESDPLTDPYVRLWMGLKPEDG